MLMFYCSQCMNSPTWMAATKLKDNNTLYYGYRYVNQSIRYLQNIRVSIIDIHCQLLRLHGVGDEWMETFLISNFRRVLNLVCILLGISPASDCGLPTFRNPLSVPSSRAGCKVLWFADVSEPSISSIFKGWM